MSTNIIVRNQVLSTTSSVFQLQNIENKAVKLLKSDRFDGF
jgi:hypothetical protein